MSEYVERQEATFCQFVVCKANDDEEDSQHGETHQLDRFPAKGVHSCNSDPIARDGAGADQDEIADGGIVEDLVDGVAFGESDGAQDDRVVKSQTIAGALLADSMLTGTKRYSQSNIKEEP